MCWILIIRLHPILEWWIQLQIITKSLDLKKSKVFIVSLVKGNDILKHYFLTVNVNLCCNSVTIYLFWLYFCISSIIKALEHISEYQLRSCSSNMLEVIELSSLDSPACDEWLSHRWPGSVSRFALALARDLGDGKHCGHHHLSGQGYELAICWRDRCCPR